MNRLRVGIVCFFSLVIISMASDNCKRNFAGKWRYSDVAAEELCREDQEQTIGVYGQW